jgi:hypothetical protein
MNTYENGKGITTTVITWLVVGIVVIVAIKLAFLVIGSILGFGLFLIFTLGPVLLAGWLAMKVLRRFSRDRALDPF